MDHATKLRRLEENVAAAGVTLTADDLHEIDEALADIDILGDRYPQHLQQTVDR